MKEAYVYGKRLNNISRGQSKRLLYRTRDPQKKIYSFEKRPTKKYLFMSKETQKKIPIHMKRDPEKNTYSYEKRLMEARPHGIVCLVDMYV